MAILSDVDIEKLRFRHFSVFVDRSESQVDPVLAELRILRTAIERQPRIDLRSKALLTLDEVAELLGVSRRTVDGLTNVRCPKPRLRIVREGKCVRVTQQDLEDYVDRLRQEAAHPPVKRRR